MHIEPGMVAESRMWLGYVTAAGAASFGLRLVLDKARVEGAVSIALRSLVATVLVFAFFELLPHYSVGVSEVHLILGSTLFLILGAAPAAIGLSLGLLLQGLLVSQFDLPQYGMNVTTLLVPLFGLSQLARRIIAPGTPYVSLSYGQALALSTSYQAGIVGWVAFWAFYGQGVSLTTLASVASFGGAYMLVIVLEPLVDLGALALAKGLDRLRSSDLVDPRLYAPARIAD